MPDPVLEMKRISKSFSGNAVLSEVDFALKPGEIHALVGENGAGKSTLMKILCGVYQPDAGEIRVNGKVIKFHSSMDSRSGGIAMVFQEFSLIPTLTVAQNIFLTREARSRLKLLDDRQDERRASQL